MRSCFVVLVTPDTLGWVTLALEWGIPGWLTIAAVGVIATRGLGPASRSPKRHLAAEPARTTA